MDGWCSNLIPPWMSKQPRQWLFIYVYIYIINIIIYIYILYTSIFTHQIYSNMAFALRRCEIVNITVDVFFHVKWEKKHILSVVWDRIYLANLMLMRMESKGIQHFQWQDYSPENLTCPLKINGWKMHWNSPNMMGDMLVFFWCIASF